MLHLYSFNYIAPPNLFNSFLFEFCCKNHLPTSHLSFSPCMLVLHKISFHVTLFFPMYPAFLLSAPLTFLSLTKLFTPKYLHHVFSYSLFYFFLSFFLSYSFSDPPPQWQLHWLWNEVRYQWVARQSQGSTSGGEWLRGESLVRRGCVGTEMGSHGLKEVKRRGRDRWGRADRHERSNKRREGLRKKQRMIE